VAPAQLNDYLKDIQGTGWPERVHYPAVVNNEKIVQNQRIRYFHK
jgi:hypothetical protein